MIMIKFKQIVDKTERKPAGLTGGDHPFTQAANFPPFSPRYFSRKKCQRIFVAIAVNPSQPGRFGKRELLSRFPDRASQRVFLLEQRDSGGKMQIRIAAAEVSELILNLIGQIENLGPRAGD